jgi:hypothetical protein
VTLLVTHDDIPTLASLLDQLPMISRPRSLRSLNVYPRFMSAVIPSTKHRRKNFFLSGSGYSILHLVVVVPGLLFIPSHPALGVSSLDVTANGAHRLRARGHCTCIGFSAVRYRVQYVCVTCFRSGLAEEMQLLRSGMVDGWGGNEPLPNKANFENRKICETRRATTENFLYALTERAIV